MPNTNRTQTVAFVCRKAVLEGKTDPQLERVLKRKFQMDQDKAHYNASWYRSEVRRKGLKLKDLH